MYVQTIKIILVASDSCNAIYNCLFYILLSLWYDNKGKYTKKYRWILDYEDGVMFWKMKQNIKLSSKFVKSKFKGKER